MFKIKNCPYFTLFVGGVQGWVKNKNKKVTRDKKLKVLKLQATS